MPQTSASPPPIKLLMLGDSGVGKSSLMMRYAENNYDPNMLSTAGVDYKVKTVFIDEQEYRLQIWDTAGQERFKTITQAYYRGAHGVLLVYDVTEQSSFDNVRYWMRSLDKHAQKGVKRMLVANKIDLEDDRKVTSGQGRKLANETSVDYIETSAADNLFVTDMFMKLAAVIAEDAAFRLSVVESESRGPVVKFDSKRQKKKSGCC